VTRLATYAALAALVVALASWGLNQREHRLAAERNLATAITERDLARTAEAVADAYRRAAEDRARDAQAILDLIE